MGLFNCRRISDYLWLIIGYNIIVNMENEGRNEKGEVINSVSFNADNSFMAIATNIGFKIYSTQPFALRHQRDFGTPLQFV